MTSSWPVDLAKAACFISLCLWRGALAQGGAPAPPSPHPPFLLGDEGGTGLSDGALAGIIVGSVLGAALLVAVTCVLACRCSRNKKQGWDLEHAMTYDGAKMSKNKHQSLEVSRNMPGQLDAEELAVVKQKGLDADKPLSKNSIMMKWLDSVTRPDDGGDVPPLSFPASSPGAYGGKGVLGEGIPLSTLRGHQGIVFAKMPSSRASSLAPTYEASTVVSESHGGANKFGRFTDSGRMNSHRSHLSANNSMGGAAGGAGGGGGAMDVLSAAGSRLRTAVPSGVFCGLIPSRGGGADWVSLDTVLAAEARHSSVGGTAAARDNDGITFSSLRRPPRPAGGTASRPLLLGIASSTSVPEEPAVPPIASSFFSLPAAGVPPGAPAVRVDPPESPSATPQPAGHGVSSSPGVTKVPSGTTARTVDDVPPACLLDEIDFAPSRPAPSPHPLSPEPSPTLLTPPEGQLLDLH